MREAPEREREREEHERKKRKGEEEKEKRKRLDEHTFVERVEKERKELFFFV